MTPPGTCRHSLSAVVARPTVSRRRLLAGFAAVALVGPLVGCGGEDPDAPPEISYGRDVCDSCGMIISEARFAAAYRTADGTTRRFDDLGDMVDYGLETSELGGARVWVHDYDTEEWLEAPAATYVLAAGFETPMSRGVVAFSTRAAAEALATDLDGDVLSWDELVAVARDGGLEPQGPAPTPDRDDNTQEETTG